MGMNSAIAVVEALIYAYYDKRDLEGTLACVTDDIVWIGTEPFDTAYSKTELREMLAQDIAAFPDALAVKADEPKVRQLNDNVAVLAMTGRQLAVEGQVCGLSLRATFECVKQENGWLVNVLHASVPNTELERFSLQRELDRTRRKEKTLTESIPGGTAIYRLKKDGRVLTEYVSEGLAKMLGYTAPEFLRKLRDNALSNLVPEDRERVMERVNTCIANGKPVSAIYRVYTKAQEECLIRLDANVMPDDDMTSEDLAVLYAVHNQVSEESQQALKEQRHYRLILNMTGTAFFEWDRRDGFYASDKFSDFAFSEQGILSVLGTGEGGSSVFPDDREALQNYFTARLEKKDPAPVTVRMRIRDGSYRWTEIVGYVETDGNGEYTRVVGVLRDVDKEWERQNRRLQAALDEAQEANRAKTDFLSRVSHDMRTPLNGILGLTSLLKEAATDERMQDDLEHLEISGNYLLNLINDTLDVSRIESGKLELHPRVCDGRALFNNILSLARPGIERKQQLLNVHADNIPFMTLYVDEGRVEQIIMNIIGNAMKFTPEGGQIDFTIAIVSVSPVQITYRVTIRDNGIGMSREFLPHLFEPFMQEHGSTTASNLGTGLGLTITRQLVQLMGGEIDVDSSLGQGTTLSITLPLLIATPQQVEDARKVKEDCVDDHALSGRHILLCEDHPLNTQIATRLLERKRMVVDHAENGRVCVDMFEAAAPGYYDAILMDIRMPVMDGLAAAQAIRTMERSDARRIPIIAMTANAFEDDMRKTREAGMDAHLAKPIDCVKLYRTLESLMKLDRRFTRRKVLVVDDSEINCAVIREAICADYDVFDAANGEEALEVMQRRRDIDVVVTDIQMPKMNGMELIRRIRANSAWRHVAIIANTQYGDPAQEEILLGLGADDFVYKPTTPKIVEIRIRNALRKA